MLRHFVNGRQVDEKKEAKVDPSSRIRIGSGELGNWGLPEGKTPRTEVRSFNGRMDEFLMFKEALSAKEIERIFEIGKPN
ncbi:LamG domain-containing protein [Verrucomicrobium spinosum]|nr:LamG domain-containing protein [Verrucomicrobium spinosum]